MTHHVRTLLDTHPKDLGRIDKDALAECIEAYFDCAQTCTACQACGEECEQHADMHEHCKVCAKACRRCEKGCTDLLATLG